MHRWNDHLRTIDLTELDKQAHKAAITWILGKYEEDEGAKLDWEKIAVETLYSFISRLALTDLKPQVYHRIADEKAKEVNEFVLKEFDTRVPETSKKFRNGLVTYLANGEEHSTEGDIIRAAHYLATRWEFRTIYDANRSMYGIEQTRAEIDQQIYQYGNLAGVKKIMEDESAFNIVDLIGQLRFQQRWARTPRIPKTTVLGHSLMVADSILLSDMDKGAGKRQIYNDFYTALFHDLPEVLTKDVITPVKTSVGGLPELLESYERELVESRIMPLIPEGWRDELRMMVFSPFEDVDDPVYGIRRGRDIKACDNLAAYMEAQTSIRYGISSKALRDGVVTIRAKLEKNGKGIGAKSLIYSFDNMEI
ncbi:MAG: HD domain-containing protein [Candidatus Methanomethylophilaceae archaeon]|nr:HD domain-containing protein [Candidatus Methanomethylophilaceae archaeon]